MVKRDFFWCVSLVICAAAFITWLKKTAKEKQLFYHVSEKKKERKKNKICKVYFANHLYIQVLPTGLDNIVRENWNMNTYSSDSIEIEPE